MKWTIGILSLTLLISGQMGCNRGKKIESEQILKDVVVALCGRMSQCQPEAMPNAEICQQTMQTALSKNKDLPKLSTTEESLNKCITSINKAECDGLFGEKPPQDCGFLQ